MATKTATRRRISTNGASANKRAHAHAQPLPDGEATLRVLLHAPTEARLLIGVDGTIIAMNDRAAERLAQLSGQRLARNPERLIGVCIFDLMPPDVAAERRARNAKVARSGQIVKFEDEREGRWMENTICPVFDAKGKVNRLVILSKDITDLKDAQRDLRTRAQELEQVNRYLADTLGHLSRSQEELKRALKRESERAKRDPLTGVLNHRAFMEELAAIMGDHRRRPTAVAMVDIDHMKPTNDAYGHQVGDAVLRSVAKALSRPGAIVARYGGDEFVVALPNTTRTKAHKYCADVTAAVHRARVMHAESKTRVPVGVSMGIAMHPQDGREPLELIKRADGAMYSERRMRRLEPAPLARRSRAA
jgi:diguanylate cyclase (GGDEF)-like protein/PAS domain S-box-containing protein